MKKLLFLPVFVVGSMIISNAQTLTTNPKTETKAQETTMSFSATEYNFGNIKQGESVTREFVFVNNSKAPLVITNAVGSCGCTVPEYPKEPIAAKAKGTIKVTFNSAGKSGAQDKTVTLTYNDGQQMVLHMKGNVEVPTATPQSTTTAPAK